MEGLPRRYYCRKCSRDLTGMRLPYPYSCPRCGTEHRNAIFPAEPRHAEHDDHAWQVLDGKPLAEADDILGAMLAARTILEEGQADHVRIIGGPRDHEQAEGYLRDGAVVFYQTDGFGKVYRNALRADQEMKRRARG